MLFVFVEGPDDERFFNSILDGYDIKIIKYAKKKREYVNSYIKSIKSMPNNDYVLFCDADLKSVKDKKLQIQELYPQCEEDKIIVSVVEIESWYIAGLDEQQCRNMKVKYYEKTDCITKEQFDALIPARLHRINFMINILKVFNLSVAIQRNKSFNYCVSYIGGMEMAVS